MINNIKDILKKSLFFVCPVIVMCIIGFGLYITSTQQFVLGAAGNEKGDFVVVLALEDTKKGFRVYNNEGKLVNYFKIKYRGSFQTAVVDEYIIIQDNSTGSRKYYDFSGNVPSGVPAFDEDLFSPYPRYTLRKDETWTFYDCSISYKQDKWGDEYINYNKGGKSINVDIDYEYCKKIKYSYSFIFLLFIITVLLVIGFREKALAICEKISEKVEKHNKKVNEFYDNIEARHNGK